jgi:glycosyltransferase involved in cell wall biosynthesis
MNRALKASRGEYVVFLCADDFLLQGFLRKEAQLLDCHPSVAFVHCMTISETGCLSKKSWDWPQIVNGRDFILGLFSGEKLYFFSSVMARQKLLIKAGGFDMSFAYNTDEYTWLRLALEGEVGFIAECLTGNDCVRGELSRRFSEGGRHALEELRLKVKFARLAYLVAPEFSRIKNKLLTLACLSITRYCLSLRREGESLGAIVGIWRRCVAISPRILAHPKTWLHLGGAIFPKKFIQQFRYYLRREMMVPKISLINWSPPYK